MGRGWVPLSAKSLMLLSSGCPAPATTLDAPRERFGGGRGGRTAIDPLCDGFGYIVVQGERGGLNELHWDAFI